MIVDDELLVRVGIKSIVAWEEYGYTIIGEAGSGREALDKIRQEQPDIILTDLVMEDIDGFQLIKTCQQQYPQIRLIALSSYNDFENVKRAMKLGAVDYIFKLTANPHEIIKSLDEIQFEQPKAEEESYSSLLWKNRTVMKCNLLRKAISPAFRTGEELTAEFKKLSLKVDFERPYHLFFFSIDNYILFCSEDRQAMKIDLLKYAVENIVEEVIGEKYRCEVFDYDRGDMIVMIQQIWKSNAVAALKERFGRINEHLERYLDVSISGSGGELCQGFERLNEELTRIQQRLDGRFSLEPGGFYLNQAEWDETGTESISLQLATLQDYLHNRSLEQVMKSVETVYSLCRDNRVSVQGCRMYFLEILYLMKEFLNGEQFLSEFRDRNGVNLYDGTLYYDFFSSIRDSYLEFLKACMANRAEGRSRFREEMVQVKAFVRENLREPVTVSIAAGLVCMSDNYFSHVFKKEMGISFVDYVNQERISKAKELLLTTDCKVYEIAEQVGIGSSNYFGILFKKLTGKSPNEFRDR